MSGEHRGDLIAPGIRGPETAKSWHLRTHRFSTRWIWKSKQIGRVQSYGSRKKVALEFEGS